MKCDVTTDPSLDYQYDGFDVIVGLREKSVDEFHVRNVIHHMPDIKRTIRCLKRYLKIKGKIVIIDCDDKHFKTNVCLDNVWYRFINKNNKIFISQVWRDYFAIMRDEGFVCQTKTNDGFKDMSTWILLRKEV